MRIYDRFTCPDAPLVPPENPVDEILCPRCGVCAALYYCDVDGEIVGCEECLQPVWANELL